MLVYKYHVGFYDILGNGQRTVNVYNLHHSF